MDPFNDKKEALAGHVFEDLRNSRKPYVMPDKRVLNELFECLFYASMNTEEGELVKVRVAFYNPNEPDLLRKRKKIDGWHYIPFEKPIPLDIRAVVKLSKSADPWSSSLAVFYNGDNQLFIYGLIDQAVHSESFLNHETGIKPDQAGLFQVSIIGVGSLSVIREYNLVATLKQNTLVTEFIDVLKFGPVSKLLKQKAEPFMDEIALFIKENYNGITIDDYATTVNNAWRDTISRLLIHVRNYHHGGALLITNSMAHLKVKYRVNYNRLSRSMSRLLKWSIADDVMDSVIGDQRNKPLDFDLFDDYVINLEKKKASQNELKGAIRFVSSHSCVDGLILLNDNLEELGYGVVIEEINPPKYIYQSLDNLGTEETLERKLSSQFGTRHQSMISFCWTHPGSLGFVVSQDGDIRAFTRVSEKLLMWENIKTHKYLKPFTGKRPLATKV